MRATRARIVLPVLLLAASGCGFAEPWVRGAHVAQARADLGRNRCDAAWDNLDYAQASREVSVEFDASTALLRARCLSQVGRALEADAYYRFIATEYAGTPAAEAASAEPAVPRPEAGACPASYALRAEEGSYYRGARAVKLGGSARVRMTFDAPTAIAGLEIVEATHPLIAAMALESAAGCTLDPDEPGPGFPCTKELRFIYDASR